MKDAFIEGKGPVSTLRLFMNGVLMAARHPTVNARKDKSAVKRFAIRIFGAWVHGGPSLRAHVDHFRG